MSTAPGHIIPMLLVHLLLIAIASPAQAQADSGSRVRITTSGSQVERWVGTLLSADNDSVRLMSSRDRRVVALPMAQVIRVEQSRGRQSSAGRGAVIGALALGGTGLVLGLVASAEEDSWYEIGPGEVALVTLMFAAAGSGIGALAGSLTRHDQWDPVALPLQHNRHVRGAARAKARFVIRF